MTPPPLTLYISTTGSDENDGSYANPFASIQYGIDIANEGQIVVVAPGTYHGVGNIDLDFDGKAITLMSAEGAEQTIIDCGSANRGFTFEDGEDSTSVLDGFTITNGSRPEGGGIYCYYSSPTIKNCIITNCWGNNGGGMYLYEASPSLSNVSISGNTAQELGGGIYVENIGWNSMAIPRLENLIITGNSANSGGGIACYLFSHPSLENVTISNNTGIISGGGIWSWEAYPSLENVMISSNTAGPYGGGGIYSYSSGISLLNVIIIDNWTSGPGGGMQLDSSNPTLTHVTISGNVATGEYGFGGAIYHETVSSSTLVNCILWNNSPQEIYFSDQENGFYSGSTTAAYCDIQGGENGIITNDNSTVSWGEGNIDADPLFTNPDNGDFSLQENSPCRNAGTADTDGDGTDDITDYNGSAPDMGAIEYVGTICPNLGDLNGDSAWDVLDIVTLVNCVLVENCVELPNGCAGDLNGDGAWDVLDIVTLVNCVLAGDCG